MKCRSCKYLYRLPIPLYGTDMDDELYVWTGAEPELWMCAHEDHKCWITDYRYSDGPIISEDELPQPGWCPRKPKHDQKYYWLDQDMRRMMLNVAESLTETIYRRIDGE